MDHVGLKICGVRTPRLHGRKITPVDSGAGTNLKVGAPIRIKSGGTDVALKAQLTISRFDKRFRGCQCSFVKFLFAVLLLTVPPAPSHLQKWGHVPSRATWSRRHCLWTLLTVTEFS